MKTYNYGVLGMVLCLKSAEALTHMLFGDSKVVFDWFPEALRITQERLDRVVFEGRKGMKAADSDVVENGDVGSMNNI